MNRRPRKTFKLLLFLLAGAIINVAVAWGCATLSQLTITTKMFDDPNESESQWWAAHRESRSPDHPTTVYRTNGFGLDASLIMGDQSGNAQLQNQEGTLVVYAGINDKLDELQTIIAGWPLASLTGSVWRYDVTLGMSRPILGQTKMVGASSSRRTGAIEFDTPNWVPGSSYRMLPVLPILPGFAINTIFYAVVLWVLFAVPGRVRRWRRIKRGQCASCGYSLRENVSEKCPECGATGTSRA